MVDTFTVLVPTNLGAVRAETTGLSDFGGDVSQYMSLLKGSSAFSFSPGEGEEEDGGEGEPGGFLGDIGGLGGGGGGKEGDDKDESLEEEQEEIFRRRRRRGDCGSEKGSTASPSATTAMGDFGGDYGNYLKLLEDDTALGFNPQADPISDNQVGKLPSK